MPADGGSLTTLVAFDLETTGLFARTDRVVEIGAARFDAAGHELETFTSLVDPERPISPSSQAIHGIGDADVRGAPRAAEILPRFLEWLGPPGRSRLLAHNAAFDCGFLGRELSRAGYPCPEHEVIDTLDLARRAWPEAPAHRLEILAGFLGLDLGEPHRALADCRRVRGLWLAARERVEPSLWARYRIFDPQDEETAPIGWESLARAITNGFRVRIEYEGGSHGPRPREISPRRFVHKGGIAYVVALCHHDGFEKSFRLDRVRRHEILSARSARTDPVRASRTGGGS